MIKCEDYEILVNREDCLEYVVQLYKKSTDLSVKTTSRSLLDFELELDSIKVINPYVLDNDNYKEYIANYFKWLRERPRIPCIKSDEVRLEKYSRLLCYTCEKPIWRNKMELNRFLHSLDDKNEKDKEIEKTIACLYQEGFEFNGLNIPILLKRYINHFFTIEKDFGNTVTYYGNVNGNDQIHIYNEDFRGRFFTRPAMVLSRYSEDNCTDDVYYYVDLKYHFIAKYIDYNPMWSLDKPEYTSSIEFYRNCTDTSFQKIVELKGLLVVESYKPVDVSPELLNSPNFEKDFAELIESGKAYSRFGSVYEEFPTDEFVHLEPPKPDLKLKPEKYYFEPKRIIIPTICNEKTTYNVKNSYVEKAREIYNNEDYHIEDSINHFQSSIIKNLPKLSLDEYNRKIYSILRREFDTPENILLMSKTIDCEDSIVRDFYDYWIPQFILFTIQNEVSLKSNYNAIELVGTIKKPIPEIVSSLLLEEVAKSNGFVAYSCDYAKFTISITENNEFTAKIFQEDISNSFEISRLKDKAIDLDKETKSYQDNDLHVDKKSLDPKIPNSVKTNNAENNGDDKDDNVCPNCKTVLNSRGECPKCGYGMTAEQRKDYNLVEDSAEIIEKKDVGNTSEDLNNNDDSNSDTHDSLVGLLVFIVAMIIIIAGIVYGGEDKKSTDYSDSYTITDCCEYEIDYNSEVVPGKVNVVIKRVYFNEDNSLCMDIYFDNGFDYPIYNLKVYNFRVEYDDGYVLEYNEFAYPYDLLDYGTWEMYTLEFKNPDNHFSDLNINQGIKYSYEYEFDS